MKGVGCKSLCTILLVWLALLERWVSQVRYYALYPVIYLPGLSHCCLMSVLTQPNRSIHTLSALIMVKICLYEKYRRSIHAIIFRVLKERSLKCLHINNQGLQEPWTSRTRDFNNQGLQQPGTSTIRDFNNQGLQQPGTSTTRDFNNQGLQQQGTLQQPGLQQPGTSITRDFNNHGHVESAR